MLLQMAIFHSFLWLSIFHCGDCPGGSAVKYLPAKVRDTEDSGLIPGLGRSPGEGATTPLFLLGKSHGQRSLEPDGLQSWDCKELDMTECTCTEYCIVLYMYHVFLSQPSVD